MKPKEILNLKIDKIRYEYVLKDGFQIFYSYLKLSNDKIIDFPHYPNLEQKTIELRLKEVSSNFKKGKRPIKVNRRRIQGQKIIDIHYSYFENGPNEERRAHLELANGIFLTEENYGVEGMSVGLELRNLDQFEILKSELEKGFKIKSFLKEIKNVS